MKKIILLLVVVCLFGLVFAEEKTTEMVPKLTAAETQDAPTIADSSVYPFWGVPCTNYTYFAVYQDEKGREPAYMRIWLNGEWHDMNWLKGDAKSGATYVYNYVPNSGSSNFYYYEASNGVGKARGSIIDSPDNGPVLFSEKLDNNEIVLLDKDGKEIWSYPTDRDWVEGVAISKDGNYIAAVTNFYIYLFSKESNVPLWFFCQQCQIPSMVFGNSRGIAISADGSYVAGELDGTLYFFNKESNTPLWTKNIESGAIGVDMSDDGKVIAAGTGNADGGKGQKIFLFDKEGNKIGDYKPAHPGYDQTGDFYQPDVTPDGKYVAVTTGCPDRRAYLFSGTGELLFRSEQMTEDSPVHKSAISDDGRLIAYSADHQQGKDILFLYDNQGKKLWSFSSAEDGTARAVSLSSDGNHVSIGTSAGHIYFFSKNSNTPLWKFTEAGRFAPFGDLKLNFDGSLLAAGGATKKVYLFSKNSNKPLWEHRTNTWITKIDFNGEYIVAGTGPREYFFEGESVSPDKIPCPMIIQPEPIEKYLGLMGTDIERPGESMGDDEGLGGTGERGKCGNDLCESPRETFENCPEDCCLPTGCVDDVEEREIVEEPGATKESSEEGKAMEEKEIMEEKGIPGPEVVGKVERKSIFQKIIEFLKGVLGK